MGARDRERSSEESFAAEQKLARAPKAAPRTPHSSRAPDSILGNQQVHRLLSKGAIQAKLKVSQPGEADELEADRIADEIASSPQGTESATSMPLSGSADSSPRIQRKCQCSGGATCPECEVEEVEAAKGIHRKAAPGAGQGSVGSSTANNAVTGLGSGRAMEYGVRKSMESRFGHDFSSVRIHDDTKAADAAESISARAFTHGTDIAFGQGEYAPQTLSGLRLLTHELVHVIQQRGAHDRVNRTPAGQYETVGQPLSAENVSAMAKSSSFWEEKIGRSFELKPDPRLSKDPEERDAVLSAVLKVRPPEGFKATVTELVRIPARKIAGSKILLYKFTYIPQRKKLPIVQVDFVAEDTSAIVKPTGPAPAGFAVPLMNLTAVGFPGDNPKRYWKENPDERDQVIAWVQNKAPNSFDQVVSTSVTTVHKKKTVTREIVYQVSGSRDAMGNITNLTVTFLGSPHQSEQTPDPDYHSKDVMDEAVEHAQTVLDPKTKDKLGTIKGLSGLPQDEQLSVKHAIVRYFEGGTRNSEVDAIVPLPDSTRRILYTFRFKPKTNDVEVERIGEEGRDAKIAPPRLSLARISRFAELSKDVPKLKDWVRKRYPSVTPTGNTAKEVCANVDAQIRAGAGTPKWFQDNYGIVILDATAGAKRLLDVHKRDYSPVQVADMKNFTADELVTLESTLETMSDSIVAGFSGIQMARQEVRLELDGTKTKPKGVPNRKEAGLSMKDGNERSIVIFDQFKASIDLRFMGGRRAGGSIEVEPSSAGTLAHELGHTVSWGPGIKEAFDKMVKKEKLETFTWYAKSDPKEEFFAESFMMFQLDPDWLSANSPKIFHFFDVLTKTGSPP